jgi:hypothetical protein
MSMMDPIKDAVVKISVYYSDFVQPFERPLQWTKESFVLFTSGSTWYIIVIYTVWELVLLLFIKYYDQLDLCWKHVLETEFFTAVVRGSLVVAFTFVIQPWTWRIDGIPSNLLSISLINFDRLLRKHILSLCIDSLSDWLSNSPTIRLYIQFTISGSPSPFTPVYHHSCISQITFQSHRRSILKLVSQSCI